MLAPLGWLYLGLASLHHGLYDRGLRRVETLPIPVISVGNLVAGGSGKTPTVAWLCTQLTQRGYRVGIVSRGHGGRRDEDPLLVARAGHLFASAAQAGDEAVQLARSSPAEVVVVGIDRVAAARLAQGEGAELIVLDDGFQHRRLDRSLNLLLLDAEKPFGSGRGLPAGPLREPLRGLRRAEMILLTRATPELFSQPQPLAMEALPETLCRALRSLSLAHRLPVFSARHSPRVLRDPSGTRCALTCLEKTRVLAVSGIARPEDFERSLRHLGARVVAHLARSDHHAYDSRDSAEILRLSGKYRAKMIVTTAKDAERWPSEAPKPHVLEIALDLSAPEAFLTTIAAHLPVPAGGSR